MCGEHSVDIAKVDVKICCNERGAWTAGAEPPHHHHLATAHWLSKPFFINTEDWSWCQGNHVYVCLRKTDVSLGGGLDGLETILLNLSTCSCFVLARLWRNCECSFACTQCVCAHTHAAGGWLANTTEATNWIPSCLSLVLYWSFFGILWQTGGLSLLQCCCCRNTPP